MGGFSFLSRSDREQIDQVTEWTGINTRDIEQQVTGGFKDFPAKLTAYDSSSGYYSWTRRAFDSSRARYDHPATVQVGTPTSNPARFPNGDVVDVSTPVDVWLRPVGIRTTVGMVHEVIAGPPAPPDGGATGQPGSSGVPLPGVFQDWLFSSFNLTSGAPSPVGPDIWAVPARLMQFIGNANGRDEYAVAGALATPVQWFTVSQNSPPLPGYQLPTNGTWQRIGTIGPFPRGAYLIWGVITGASGGTFTSNAPTMQAGGSMGIQVRFSNVTGGTMSPAVDAYTITRQDTAIFGETGGSLQHVGFISDVKSVPVFAVFNVTSDQGYFDFDGFGSASLVLVAGTGTPAWNPVQTNRLMEGNSSMWYARIEKSEP